MDHLMTLERLSVRLHRAYVIALLSQLITLTAMWCMMGLMGLVIGIASTFVGATIGRMGRPSEHVGRATRAFSWFAALAPRRVWQEEAGDALEVIAAMEKAGCSAFKIRLKIWSTVLWVLLNGVREFVAGLAGRKSPLK